MTQKSEVTQKAADAGVVGVQEELVQAVGGRERRIEPDALVAFFGFSKLRPIGLGN